MNEISNEKCIRLYGDCNSLNAIAGYLRNNGADRMAGVLLAIESHIFDILDDLERE